MEVENEEEKRQRYASARAENDMLTALNWFGRDPKWQQPPGRNGVVWKATLNYKRGQNWETCLKVLVDYYRNRVSLEFARTWGNVEE